MYNIPLTTKPKLLVFWLGLALSAPLGAATPIKVPIDPWTLSYQSEAAGDLGGALAVLKPQLEQPESQELAWLRHGWLLYSQASYEEAYQAYRQSLQLNSQSLDARMGMMLARMAQQKWQEAFQEGQSALAGGDNYLLQVRLLVCQESLKDWAGLRDRAQALALRVPSEVAAWIYLARAHGALGTTRAAQSAWRQVLRLSPSNEEALLQINILSRSARLDRPGR